MIKNKFMTILIVFSFLLLSGCDMKTSIYNNDKKISKSYDSFNISNSNQNIDGTELTGTIEKMIGMSKVWNYDSDEDIDLDISYRFNVLNGKLKLALIYPDDSVETVVEVTKDSNENKLETNTIHLKKGYNRIKIIACDDAKFDYSLNVPKGHLKKIGF